MARLGETLGWASNPFYKAFDANRSAIVSGFAGIGADPRNPAGGFSQGFANGMQLDQQRSDQQAEEEQRLAQINQTAAFLRSKGAEDLAAAVEGGMTTGADAFNQWYQQANAQPELTADMQNFQFAQANPGFAEFLGGAGEAPQIVETFDAETGQPIKGYMQGTTFVPVGGAKQPGARDNPMNSTIQREIFEADDAVLAGQSVVSSLGRALELNETAYDGPWAEQRAYTSALFGDQAGVDTLQLKNEVTAQALDQLKAIFGGMPTEGERKILIEIQGAADQPRAVRESIYKRAIDAANRRIAANQQKAQGLRDGSYFDPTFGQAPTNTTSTGLQWSIEP